MQPIRLHHVAARAIVLCAAIAAGGCAALSEGETARYFVLEAGTTAGAVSAAPAARPSVLVAPTSASGFYDTQDIVYSRVPGMRAYYQFSHWTERPQRAIHAELASRLDTGGRRDGLELVTHLEEIYHDAAEPPGRARITLAAELLRADSRAVLARRSFSQSAPATSYDAPGAVQGFRKALGALLDEVATWVADQAPPPAPPRAAPPAQKPVRDRRQEPGP